MNKLKKIFTILLFFFFIFILFKYNFLLESSVLEAVNIWLRKVFPSLFIVLIFNDIIINTNFLDNFTSYFNTLFNKIFHTSGNAFAIFILSIFSGSPTNAFIIKEMLNNNKISLITAQKLMKFTYFSNSLFLYNILSLSFNKYITIKIIIIHYISNIIIGLIFRGKEESFIENKDKNNKSVNFLTILPKSINKSINTLLTILGTIIFYMIISNIIINMIPKNDLMTTIIKGFLEITQGLNSIINLQSISIIKEVLAISIISFGGLSIHTQVLALTTDIKSLYKNYLLGRIYHVLISANTYLFIYFITTC